MLIEWMMSIGIKGAEVEGAVDVDDKELEGFTDEQRREAIQKAIYEDALAYVDVWPTGEVK
jgi:hypothetical protein